MNSIFACMSVLIVVSACLWGTASNAQPKAEADANKHEVPIDVRLLAASGSNVHYTLQTNGLTPEHMKQTWYALVGLKNLTSLRIEFPASIVDMPVDGALAACGGWASLSAFRHLTRLSVNRLPAESIELITAHRGIAALEVEELYSRVVRGPAHSWGSFTEEYAEHFRCLGEAHHIRELTLPLAVPSDVLQILRGMKELTKVRLVGERGPESNRFAGRFPELCAKPGLVHLEVPEFMAHHRDQGTNHAYLETVAAHSDIESFRLVAQRSTGNAGDMILAAHEWYVASERRKHREYPALRKLSVQGSVGSHFGDVEWEGIPGLMGRRFYGAVHPAGPNEMKPRYSGLRLLRNLEELEFEFSDWIRTDLLFPAVSDLPKLRSLTLWQCLTVAVPDDFSALAASTSLEELNLKNCRNITDDCLREIAKIPNLRRLVLDGCYRVTAEGIGHLKAATKLECLHWRGTYQANDAAMAAIAGLPESMRELHLDQSWSNVGDAGRKALAMRGNWLRLTLPGSLANGRTLNTLTSPPKSSESGWGWNDDLLKLLAEQSPALTHFRLAGRGVTAAGINELKRCKSLTHLTLSSQELTKDLAVAIGSLGSLTHVWLEPPAGYRGGDNPTAESEVILDALINAREGKSLNISLRPWESVE